MKEPSDYQYQPLVNSELSIRLIKLAPAQWPLTTSMFDWSNTIFGKHRTNTNPSLTSGALLCLAINIYRWGLCHEDDQKPRRGLETIPLADKPRLVWADAVCINQKGNDEKSKQVLKMDIIYRQGSKTLAWLGCGFEDNRISFDSLRCVAARAPVLSIFAWSLE